MHSLYEAIEYLVKDAGINELPSLIDELDWPERERKKYEKACKILADFLDSQ